MDVPSTLKKKNLKKKNSDVCSSNAISGNSEIKQKKKRKKEEVVVPDIIHELKEDLDRELDIKAQRNNFTATNVKNMIKAVITDSEVLKMIDYSLDKTTEKPVYEFKLTRAKTKELIGLDQNAIWRMPSTKKKSDIVALISQELSEEYEESDEEYEPNDEGSDDDSKANENIIDEESVIDEESIIDDDCSENDSAVLEIVCPNLNESNSNENIGQRTRSKLCLTETPLEEIEQANAIPPDTTTDLYVNHCDNQDWLNFLNEFYFDSNQLENNDDENENENENDPDFNVMVDEETEGTDIEELRMDRAVKVTKKELNELMSELFEYTEMLSSDDEEENKGDLDSLKPRSIELINSISCSTLPIHRMEFEDKKGDICCQYHQFTEKQICLLKQHLQQHVQLLLQSFLLAYKHPLLPESYALACSKCLKDLTVFKSNSPLNGSFNILNLESSMDLLNKWIEYLDVDENLISMERFMEDELKKIDMYKKKKTIYLPEIHPKLVELCFSSDAFMYPLYLPNGGFTGSCLISRGFSVYEHQLIAMGLEEFSDLLGLLPQRNEDLRKIVELINYYTVTTKSIKRILAQIQKLRKSSTSNPIKEYFKTNKAPEVYHYVVVQDSLKKLSDYSLDFFPQLWEKYLLVIKGML